MYTSVEIANEQIDEAYYVAPPHPLEIFVDTMYQRDGGASLLEERMTPLEALRKFAAEHGWKVQQDYVRDSVFVLRQEFGKG